MPQNIIPKDNIPKIYEVREVENKIPTYEEFMKSYQTDQVVSESYENESNSYGDIGVLKDYGPCSWNNPNCECYVSQGFVLLRMPCPIDNCGMTVSNWFHSNSGYRWASNQSDCGALIMSSSGRIRCSSCGTEGNWKDWGFSCSSRQGTYNRIDADNFMNSLSITINLYPSVSSNVKRIMSGLVRTLMNNY